MRWRRRRSTSRSRPSPTPPAGRWAPPSATCASTAPRPCPAGCARGPARAQEREAYDNPHAHPGHLAPGSLLPDAVAGERFYAPDEAEPQLAERLERIRRARGPEAR